MARISKEERNSKLEALWEAFHILKKESTLKDNKVTLANICEYANSLPTNKLWGSMISEQSLKNKTDNNFAKDIRDAILAFKKELFNVKSTTTKKIEDDIKKQKLTIENLTITITELLHNEIELKTRLMEKDKTITRLKEEIELLRFTKDN